MATYTVMQGDCISSIAHKSGFFWETIWNDPGNADLKRRRQNPNALLPGDVLVVPEIRPREEQCATTRSHRFQLKGVPVKLNLRLLDNEGHPRANLPYTLTVDGRAKNAATDGDGKISETIQPDAKKAKLVLKPPGDPEETYSFNLGHMNPVDDIHGVQGRLKNLGYLQGEITGELDESTAEAIRKFQKANALPETGEPGPETQAKLADKHGG